MKYSDILRHLSERNCSTKAQAKKALKELFPQEEVDVFNDYKAYTVYVTYLGHKAFTVHDVGQYSTYVESAVNRSWRYINGKMVKIEHFINDSDQDFKRCVRLRRRERFIVDSPFAYSWGNEDECVGKKNVNDLKNILSSRRYEKRQMEDSVNSAKWEVADLLESMKSLVYKDYGAFLAVKDDIPSRIEEAIGRRAIKNRQSYERACQYVADFMETQRKRYSK